MILPILAWIFFSNGLPYLNGNHVLMEIQNGTRAIDFEFCIFSTHVPNSEKLMLFVSINGDKWYIEASSGNLVTQIYTRITQNGIQEPAVIIRLSSVWMKRLTAEQYTWQIDVQGKYEWRVQLEFHEVVNNNPIVIGEDLTKPEADELAFVVKDYIRNHFFI